MFNTPLVTIQPCPLIRAPQGCQPLPQNEANLIVVSSISKTQNELYFRSFLSYARVPFSYLSPRWRRQRVVVAACATLEGRLDFSKSPRSNPPLLEGWLDLLKSPRSNPPLLEGPLEISKRPRSMGGGTRYKGGGATK